MKDSLYRNILWYGVAALLIFTPVARGAVKIWSIALVLFVEAVLIFVWLWRLNNNDEAKFKSTPLDRPIILFAILAIISFVFSIYKHDSFYALLRLFGYIGLYYLVVNEFDHKMRKRIVWLVIFLGTALSVYGFLQYFGIFNHPWWFQKDFVAATYINHNHFAGYLELIMPLVAVIIFSMKGRRIILAAALVLMLTAFVLTQSRGAWLSLTIALLAIGFILMKRIALNKKAFIAFLSVLIVLFSLLYFGKDIISQRMDTVSQIAEGKELSIGARFKMWQGTLSLIKERPFVGTGIGTFVWAFSRYRPEEFYAIANFAHNDYLNMAAEMGVAAPFIMIWIFALIIKSGLAKKEDRLNPYALGCSIGILSLAIHGVADFNFHIPANMLLFSVWAALVMREKRGSDVKGK